MHRGKASRLFIFQKITSFFLRITNSLTSSLEDFWSVPFDLPFFFRIQAPRLLAFVTHQLTDFLGIISWRRLWGKEYCFAVFFSVTKGWWFGPDRGLLAQAIKEVEMLQATLITIANLHRLCRHHLPYICNLWQPQWRS